MSALSQLAINSAAVHVSVFLALRCSQSVNVELPLVREKGTVTLQDINAQREYRRTKHACSRKWMRICAAT